MVSSPAFEARRIMRMLLELRDLGYQKTDRHAAWAPTSSHDSPQPGSQRQQQLQQKQKRPEALDHVTILSARHHPR